MPGDDLLRFITGPLLFSSWWLVAGVFLVLLVIGWCAGVFVWTMPAAKLRRIPVIGAVHARILRRRFTRSIRRTLDSYRARTLSGPEASAGFGATVRSFLFVRTGTKAQYLHVEDIAESELATAAPLLALIDDAQFNAETRVDVAGLGRSAEELIRSWT